MMSYTPIRLCAECWDNHKSMVRLNHFGDRWVCPRCGNIIDETKKKVST